MRVVAKITQYNTRLYAIYFLEHQSKVVLVDQLLNEKIFCHWIRSKTQYTTPILLFSSRYKQLP